MSRETGRMEKVIINMAEAAARKEEKGENGLMAGTYLCMLFCAHCPIYIVDDDSPVRIIRDDTLLHGGGHKNLYYDAKFGEEHRRDSTFFPSLIESYVLGLAWVAQYYYQGCPSWSWYVREESNIFLFLLIYSIQFLQPGFIHSITLLLLVILRSISKTFA